MGNLSSTSGIPKGKFQTCPALAGFQKGNLFGLASWRLCESSSFTQRRKGFLRKERKGENLSSFSGIPIKN
jgi:hypothetical protein